MAQEKYLDQTGLSYFWQKLKAKLADKVDKEAGKGLSSNDYTSEEKAKLNGLSGLRVHDGILESESDGQWSSVNLALQPITVTGPLKMLIPIGGEWEFGAIVSSNGNNYGTESTTRLRTVSYISLDGISTITPKTGYQFVIFAYDSGTYKGAWTGSAYSKSSATWHTKSISVSSLGSHDFRLVLAQTSGGTMSLDEAENLFSTQTVPEYTTTIGNFIKQMLT